MTELLIISKADFELTTNEVCNWLNYHKIPYVRLNVDRIANPKYYEINIDFNDNTLDIFDKINFESINLKEIKVVWCRRFLDKTFDNLISDENTLDYNIIQFAKFQSTEKNQFLRILYDFYPKWIWTDYYKNTFVDKISVLKLARKNGLIVPKTYVVNSKTQLLNIMKKSPNLITKPITEGTGFFIEKGGYIMHTQKVKAPKINQFLPSLFQEQIEKEFEIRIFYLDKKTYSMAIFSGGNQKTKVDFRNYDLFNPNRYIPYNLPEEVEKKITSLMEELNLKTGSIDMIKNKNNEYVFLEVNPIGQFGMVSSPCNYHLEMKVAEYLIKKITNASKTI